ncbi:MAG TPA: PIN domain-containing protein [Chloroflexota bacterium]|nr:PIN domain-containing protein [Chloroflexota bacterium]
MKLYLDVSCLNRPFDDQSQMRIRLEADAVLLILEQCDRGDWHHVSSEIAQIEISAMAEDERRARVQLLLPDENAILRIAEDVRERATNLQKRGFKPADALHVAAAEKLEADVLLSCDDRLCRLARRHRRLLNVEVVNPLDWLKEIGDDLDS